MKLSIGFRGHDFSLIGGNAGRTGASNDQCGCQAAPSAIQLRIVAISAGDNGSFPAYAGGMRNAGFVAVMRRIISLRSGSPGTIAKCPLPRSALALGSWSSRSWLLRLALSGPWHE